jgi:heme/copper-type cytochrome/quinol oxidase subunit 2
MRARNVPAAVVAVALGSFVIFAGTVAAQNKRDVAVTGKRYTYVAADSGTNEIRVRQGDLVTVTFSAEDIAHTFTVADDHYRIDRRAEKGKPVTFRFLADKVGEFQIRCTLTIDERCAREMRGKLVVSASDDHSRR